MTTVALSLFFGSRFKFVGVVVLDYWALARSFAAIIVSVQGSINIPRLNGSWYLVSSTGMRRCFRAAGFFQGCFSSFFPSSGGGVFQNDE